MESTVETKVVGTEVVEAKTDTTTPAPITMESLQHFSPEKQKEIIAVSEQIDVLQFDKLKAFGSQPLIRTMEACDKALKDYEGTAADKQVIEMVRSLAKQANDSYDDFNIELNEANGLQKFLTKIFSGNKKGIQGDLKLKARTCFSFLFKLAEACESWEESLKKIFEAISVSSYEDKQSCYELEEYLVAGRLAEERITKEVEVARLQWEQSGILEDKDKYEALKDGLEVLQSVLINLEKSRVAYALSVVQLKLELKANKKIQIAVQTQKDHSIMVAKQQIRNALFDAANKDALNGQKSVAKLNSELMKKVAQNAVITGKEAEEIIYKGVYTVEAAVEAATTVINGCKEIEAAGVTLKESIKPEMEKLRSLFDELTPYVSEVKTSSSTTGGVTTTTGNSRLVF